MKIVVIGGNGFIGSAFTGYAADKGVELVVCDFRPPETVHRNVKNILMQEENLNIYEGLVNEGDIVIILKWKGVPATCIENGKALIESNIVGTMLLTEVCVRKKVKKIIFASSGGAIYGNQEKLPVSEYARPEPVSLYAVQKLMTEDYLEYTARTGEANIIILRISNPYGPGQRPFNGQGIVPTFMACNILGKEAEIWGDGNCVRDYLYIDDLAECLFLCTEKDIPSGIYNVGSGTGTSIFEICGCIENVTGRKMRYVIKNAGNSQVKNNILDCSKIHETIGWKASMDMQSGLRMLKAAWNGTDFGRK